MRKGNTKRMLGNYRLNQLMTTDNLDILIIAARKRFTGTVLIFIDVLIGYKRLYVKLLLR